ncbi:MAG TPA: protein glxC [Gammaproteobacteria bacterium]|nr:protein glxC [Gammaproteobacteria bacterium]
MITVDLARTPVRELNQRLHDLPLDTRERDWRILNPKGQHAIAAGLSVAVNITIEGHAGYYCAGMNQAATVVINGHAGVGLGENIMSGVVRVKGNASQSAGASGRGGMIVIEGDASARCGISMKGADIVVGGSIGHLSAFMAQTGRLVVCGDAGQSLGDSIYEATLYVRGRVGSLGADCIEKEMTAAHVRDLTELLARAGFDVSANEVRRYGSARKLYNFHPDHADDY